MRPVIQKLGMLLENIVVQKLKGVSSKPSEKRIAPPFFFVY
jgi:hypothetical protein